MSMTEAVLFAGGLVVFLWVSLGGPGTRWLGRLQKDDVDRHRQEKAKAREPGSEV